MKGRVVVRPAAKSVPVVEAEQVDAADHLNARCGAEDYGEVDLQRGEKPPREEVRDVAESEHFTDMGNARRLVQLHGRDLRHWHRSGKWFVWDGSRWRMDDTGELMRRAKVTVQSIYAEAARSSDSGTRKTISAHARASESERKLAAMVRLAASEPGIPVLPEELDSDPWLLNVQNGTLDLRTGKLRGHRRDDLITKLAPVAYDRDARSELWERFLARLLPDPEVRGFVQRSIGYSLTGLTGEQVLFFAYGTGANGKTTFMETVRSVLGDYALHTPSDTLLARRDTGIPNDVARLQGARFVSAVETEEGRRLAEVQVKMLTGGDTISARFMRGEWFEFRPVAKLWLATNHKPSVRGTDEAIWRRIRLVPFVVTIPKNERDKHLLDKLQAAGPAVLAWAVKGCAAWQPAGLDPPGAVLAATNEYQAEQDVLGVFLEDCCVVADNGSVPAAELYGAFKEWCNSTGEQPVTQRAFGQRLTERGFIRGRLGKKRRWGWFGIGLGDRQAEMRL